MARARSSAEVRRVAASALRWGRRLSASRRALPDFVILGAQKAGTTSLYNYLTAHPAVRPAARKEVHFFDLNYSKGETWYRSMFPTVRALRGQAGARLLTGEASPYYLFHPLAPQRAGEMVPNARLIVLLRDPVDRAWSHYRHEVAAGREQLSFAAALDAEPQRLAGAFDAIRRGHPHDLIANHRHFAYVARGRYAEQIRAWLRVFPRESFLFLDAAVLFADPPRAWRATMEFLGLDWTTEPTFAVHNAGRDDVLDDASRARLADTFTRPNRELEELLGMSFGWASGAA